MNLCTVLRVRDGQVVQWREYQDVAAMSQALPNR
ncbi:limonene-1,2-epoxide hydrolase [Hamadaea flava]|uniref:Limonene-1,2-epoxide hydrolase family protein n=1 Tax=Hamadaea flava TaxID=1742688 RepID=A0ABV8LU80_9ACTN|nr:limonene-1,2-epoxide hydrolase family protein [Hamadaea flava]MCP2328286.1 limonene-1,2-epoxide hydrolase [Hamadaea flava]